MPQTDKKYNKNGYVLHEKLMIFSFNVFSFGSANAIYVQ